MCDLPGVVPTLRGKVEFEVSEEGSVIGQHAPEASDDGGFYLGSIGGPAARLAQDCIKKVDVLEYAELGMEAVWKIEVRDFPAFIVVDDKGNDFFDLVAKESAALGTPVNLKL